MAIPVRTFLGHLTEDHRVLVIGGLAVIAHGYDRHTQDADVWLDPMSSAAEWARVVAGVAALVPSTTIHRLPGWSVVDPAELAEAVDESGMIRILGLDRPLDIFRCPNEFAEDAFEQVASRARKLTDGTLLVDPLDLIQSKLDTGRTRDQKDIAHLEHLVRADYQRRLPTATPAEARAMLDRYCEWQVLSAALTNPSQEVRDLATTCLRDFAAAGDPFSQAILAGRPIPMGG